MSKEDQIEDLQELLREDSENYRARRELALILIDTGFAKEAAQHLRYLLRKFPDDIQLYYNLGIAYEKQKQFELAADAYISALNIEPENPDIMYNLGLVYTELKDFQKAIGYFDKVLAKDNNDSNSYFNRGLCYLKMGDSQSALDNFLNTININEEDLYAHFYIGNIFFDNGNYDGAKAEFTRVTELSPDYSWAYYNLACIAYKEGDYQSVSTYLDKTIECNPKDEMAYINYTKLLLSLEMPEEAKMIMNSAAENCSNTGQIYYNAAQLFRNAGNTDTYIEYMNLALQNRDTLETDVDTVMEEMESVNG